MAASIAAPRLHVTASGGWMVLTGFALAAAAANSGNNLLYLLLALLIVSYPTSAWFARRVLLRVEGELIAPGEIVAGTESDAIATLEATAPAPGLILTLHAEDQRGTSLVASRAVPYLRRHASANLAMPFPGTRRGPTTLSLVARCPFPFGLVEGSRRIFETEVLVLPKPDAAWRVPLVQSTNEGAAQPRRGEGAELFDIRDHRSGDDARHVDWKATARLQRLMVRERSRDEERSLVIAVDPGRPAVPTHPLDPDEAVEAAISRAAGAVDELSREGWRLRLIAPGMDANGDARALLRALARIEISAAALGDSWRQQVEAGETVIRFSAEPGMLGSRIVQGGDA
jgi:uncharacterized protein (DUF58 family)